MNLFLLVMHLSVAPYYQVIEFNSLSMCLGEKAAINQRKIKTITKMWCKYDMPDDNEIIMLDR